MDTNRDIIPPVMIKRICIRLIYFYIIKKFFKSNLTIFECNKKYATFVNSTENGEKKIFFSIIIFLHLQKVKCILYIQITTLNKNVGTLN